MSSFAGRRVRPEPLWDRVEALLENVHCPPYEFVLSQIDPEHLMIQARLWREDAITGEWGWGYGNQQLVTRDLHDDVITKKCLVAALSYSEHEVREAFEYKGKKIFGPHISLDALAEIAEVTV